MIFVLRFNAHLPPQEIGRPNWAKNKRSVGVSARAF
jgi:hypothetical protein